MTRIAGLPQASRACAPSLLLTATVHVNNSMVLTVRRDAEVRLADYKMAFSRWLACPAVESLIFVENSGFDLSPFAAMADAVPEKRVELLSFTAPDFDGALGKGYGEMLCLQHCLDHSRLLSESARLLKVTGRYFLSNAAETLAWVAERTDAGVVCDMRLNLTWADSRAFGGDAAFLRTYLCPMIDQLNDTEGSTFEHVLARAAHRLMADRGLWVPPPFPLEIQGVSASRGREWQVGLRERLTRRARQALLAKTLSSGPR